MNKFDYKKDLKELYAPSKKAFSIIEVPAMKFIMVDGHGDPNNNPEYQAVVESLYGVAYKLKFTLKSPEYDYVVAPLEGLWWAEDMSVFTSNQKDQWDWTMMILQPERITIDIFEKTRQAVFEQKGLSHVADMRMEVFEEGLSVQILYLGAYADEGPTIARMHDFIKENGLTRDGKHHEIYLGDPRRTAPERLKTIIRQPVRKVA